MESAARGMAVAMGATGAEVGRLRVHVQRGSDGSIRGARVVGMPPLARAHAAAASADGGPMDGVEESGPSSGRRSGRIRQRDDARAAAAHEAKEQADRANSAVAPQGHGVGEDQDPGILRDHLAALQRQRDAPATPQQLTEAIGELNATKYMQDNFPEYALVVGFGPGVGIDQIWRTKDADGNSHYILVEAKGPGAGLGQADAYGGQMSYSWIHHHAQTLAADDEPHYQAIGNDILTAMTDPDSATGVYGLVLQAHARGDGARQVNEWGHVQSDETLAEQHGLPEDTFTNRNNMAVYHRAGYDAGGDGGDGDDEDGDDE